MILFYNKIFIKRIFLNKYNLIKRFLKNKNYNVRLEKLVRYDIK